MRVVYCRCCGSEMVEDLDDAPFCPKCILYFSDDPADCDGHDDED